MDEIEKLAREHGTGGWQTLEDMVRFGRAVRAAEREHAVAVLSDLLEALWVPHAGSREEYARELLDPPVRL